MWDSVSNEIRNRETVSVFKSKIQIVVHVDCVRNTLEVLVLYDFVLHKLILNDFLHLGFVLSDCICFLFHSFC